MRCFIYFAIRKLKKKTLLYKLRWFKTISRPEKSREILVKHAYSITIIFYMCLISQSAVSGQSRVACRDFLELWLLKKKKKRKIRISNRQCHSKFLRRGSKKKKPKEKPKVRSLTWVMVFLVAENENRQLEDLPQADFGREHENISLVGKEKVNN